MDSNSIRQTFLDFFRSKNHVIVPSAPMVVKNDPTLMFNNSGMAPFKDIFLGNAPIKHPRVADTQKCLRVSGKHNDLEEVGVDTYHHTMFEMLGNWSFGDYFKKEAIAWAWELLTEVYKIPKDRLYVTVFEGDKKENLAFDQEAYDTWKQFIAEERILNGSKKDNFWEMGDQGPCGPCSEIHVDMRDDAERNSIPGKDLVNRDHPQVIEIWNNVFMEFNRKADGSLEKLPRQHVDTGMGFERLCMVLQGKKATYDTDVFQPMINFIEKESGKNYRVDEKTDIAMRVMSDHIRTIAFAIADGQLPGNNKAGYVIRRILRRAVRYGYTFLGFDQPFMYRMVKVLAAQMGGTFPEILSQQSLIEKVIREEEASFLRTLGNGINRFEDFTAGMSEQGVINGQFAFELYDTYGFPIDLTQLLARERRLSVNMDEFNACMQEQKERSRAAAAVDTDDWVIVIPDADTEFIGYDHLSSVSLITRYRKVTAKGKDQFQLVFDITPFYAESGGQVGDKGVLEFPGEKIAVTDTRKENGVIMHLTDKLPAKLEESFKAVVHSPKRAATACNHSATHLLHAALRTVLGTHVEQKGSLVNDEYLRFDFSHFSKVTPEEIRKIENMVNEKIRENIAADIRTMGIEDAKKRGAMALFGEKYGDEVRVVCFGSDYSIELCGGTHVEATGKIGFFKITSESAVAAGVRRMEAITGIAAENYINDNLTLLADVKEALRNPKDLVKGVQALMDQNADLQKQLDKIVKEKASGIKQQLRQKMKQVNGVNFVAEIIDLDSPEAVKDICFQLRGETEKLLAVIGNEQKGKPAISVVMSDDLVKEKGWNASQMVRELAKHIQGGGGGQPFYANAGGSKPEGLAQAIQQAQSLLG